MVDGSAPLVLALSEGRWNDRPVTMGDERRAMGHGPWADIRGSFTPLPLLRSWTFALGLKGDEDEVARKESIRETKIRHYHRPMRGRWMLARLNASAGVHEGGDSESMDPGGGDRALADITRGSPLWMRLQILTRSPELTKGPKHCSASDEHGCLGKTCPDGCSAAQMPSDHTWRDRTGTCMLLSVGPSASPTRASGRQGSGSRLLPTPKMVGGRGFRGDDPPSLLRSHGALRTFGE
jgi:hypothetical protein